MTLLLTMLFACGEKEVATTTTSTTQVVETQTLEKTDEKTAETTVELAKDAAGGTPRESTKEVPPTSTETINTNEGVTND